MRKSVHIYFNELQASYGVKLYDKFGEFRCQSGGFQSLDEALDWVKNNKDSN